MSGSSIRIGFSTGSAAVRRSHLGRQFGLFHMTRRRGSRVRTIEVGYLAYDRWDLEPLREKGMRIRVTVLGVLRLRSGVSPALAREVLDARVIGWVIGDPRTKAALVERARVEDPEPPADL